MSDVKDMPEDLKWLAINCADSKGAKFISREDDGFSLTSKPYNHMASYAIEDWQLARQQLGLDTWVSTEDEEECIKLAEARMSDDMVNHPPHYQLRQGYEVYDLRQDLALKAEQAKVPYDQYSDWDRMLEYSLRCWQKNGVEDLKKARWYLDKLIDKLEGPEGSGESQ